MRFDFPIIFDLASQLLSTQDKEASRSLQLLFLGANDLEQRHGPFHLFPPTSQWLLLPDNFRTIRTHEGASFITPISMSPLPSSSFCLSIFLACLLCQDESTINNSHASLTFSLYDSPRSGRDARPRKLSLPAASSAFPLREHAGIHRYRIKSEVRSRQAI